MGRDSACVCGYAVASRDRLLASQWVIAAANFECGRCSRRVTGDRALDPEGWRTVYTQPDSFTQPWNVKKRAIAAAEVVAKISLWTYLWEADLLALFRLRTPFSPASWLSWSPSEKEAAGFSGVDLAYRDPCSSFLGVFLSF